MVLSRKQKSYNFVPRGHLYELSITRMSYQSITPDISLSPFIDAYWTVRTGDTAAAPAQRILPDGCVDIIFNLGSPVTVDESGTVPESTVPEPTVLESGKAYLIGTMTRPSLPVMGAGGYLAGIRFKPAAFSSFYKVPL